MKVQKVIRTATPNIGYYADYNKIRDLQDALKDGFRVVMCNTIRRKDGEEWLEYIVEKEDKED